MTYAMDVRNGYVDTVYRTAQRVLGEPGDRLCREYRCLLENAMRELRAALGRHDAELVWQRAEVLETVLLRVL